VIIHDNELPVTTNVLHEVFSPYGKVEKNAQFQTMNDFDARVNFYSHRYAAHAFCKLQGRQTYKGCCKLDLYFASEAICGCEPYIRQYMWDYELPGALLIPSKPLIEDCRVSSLISSKKQPTSYFHEKDHLL